MHSVLEKIWSFVRYTVLTVSVIGEKKKIDCLFMRRSIFLFRDSDKNLRCFWLSSSFRQHVLKISTGGSFPRRCYPFMLIVHIHFLCSESCDSREGNIHEGGDCDSYDELRGMSYIPFSTGPLKMSPTNRRTRCSFSRSPVQNCEHFKVFECVI
jgi:hypothetical protein